MVKPSNFWDSNRVETLSILQAGLPALSSVNDASMCMFHLSQYFSRWVAALVAVDRLCTESFLSAPIVGESRRRVFSVALRFTFWSECVCYWQRLFLQGVLY